MSKHPKSAVTIQRTLIAYRTATNAYRTLPSPYLAKRVRQTERILLAATGTRNLHDAQRVANKALRDLPKTQGASRNQRRSHKKEMLGAVNPTNRDTNARRHPHRITAVYRGGLPGSSRRH